MLLTWTRVVVVEVATDRWPDSEYLLKIVWKFFKGLDVVCERKELREEDSQELEKSVGHLRHNRILLLEELETIGEEKGRINKVLGHIVKWTNGLS